MSNTITFNDGIRNFDPGIPCTPTYIETIFNSEITTIILFNDAYPVGVPSDFELTATIVGSWGGAQSNSYITETIASSFIMTGIFDNKAWIEATWRDRRAAMLEATRDIDSLEFIGGRYYYDQLLKMPRQIPIGFPWNRTNTSSTVWSVTMLRMELTTKQATCWQTLHVLRKMGRNKYLDEIASGVRSKSASIGASSQSIDYQRNFPRLCPEALVLLQEWRSSKRVVRA